MPLLIIVPLSGTQYLLGIKGTAEKTDIISLPTPYTEDKREIQQIFKEQKIDFDFEYVKSRGTKAILRPATREHYEIHKMETGLKLVRVRPNWVKILQELHFGHGPKIMKQLQILFGISFAFVILSGFFLSWSLKKFKPLLFGSMAFGIVITIAFWNIF